ncbi:MAG: hypothetical protein ATN33_00405 [Epulopiscium sp. Nele67-Bin001]|nr:MAG: hypothetical protein BEN18_04240 [Epulopiscium sp. Nuni2H_MBin001]OON93660.1 MAG: hypothetical protein ATN33_00405 [Epulopiscium sp. Nele67-Bin001]
MIKVIEIADEKIEVNPTLREIVYHRTYKYRMCNAMEGLVLTETSIKIVTFSRPKQIKTIEDIPQRSIVRVNLTNNDNESFVEIFITDGSTVKLIAKPTLNGIAMEKLKEIFKYITTYEL